MTLSPRVKVETPTAQMPRSMPATAHVDVLLMHPDDNVCIAARNLDAGTQVEAGRHAVALLDQVTLGHKIALAPIAEGSRVLRYGQTIGFASRSIEPGEWVHTHNVTASA